MLDIISLLSTDGYIICNKTIIRMFGGDCAILLGELCAEHNYYKAQGMMTNDMFYSTQENIEANTGLDDYAQRKAVKVLVENGILEVVKMGMPAKNYYRIVQDKLFKIFTTSALNFKGQEVENLKDINNNKQKTNNKYNTNTKVLVTPKTEIVENDNPLEENTLESKPKTKRMSLYDKCVASIRDYTDDSVLQGVLVAYLEVRLKIKEKPLYGVNQWNALLKRLSSYTGDKVSIVQQSIERGWCSFYEEQKPQGGYGKNVFSESVATMTNKKGDRSALSGEEF